MTFPTKPERPYKNITEFCASPNWYYKTKDNPYPCMWCNGFGKRKITEDYEPDVIEGYKFAPVRKCPQCSGTGKYSYEDYVRIYKGMIKDWKEKLEKYKECVEPVNAALEKLTVKERKVLGLSTRKL